MPDFALKANSLPGSSIQVGSDVTIRCHIEGRNHNIGASGELVVTVNFNSYNYDTRLNETFSSIHTNLEEYYAVIPSVTEGSTGEYVCCAKLQIDEHCINKTAGVYLNVTSDDIDGKIMYFVKKMLNNFIFRANTCYEFFSGTFNNV